MVLSEFINGLLKDGNITIAGNLCPFDAADKEATIQHIKKYYDRDNLEMPFSAPAFNEEAALWSAEFFYITLQMIVLRDLNEETIQKELPVFSGKINPDTIYSADLILRFLPALFGFAKGLAPADILVTELKKIALFWPYSSVGIELEDVVNEDIVLSHPSLKTTYIDRIIQKKDAKRIRHTQISNLINETIGTHKNIFWPELEIIEHQ